MKQFAKKGFTLIELMIVIVILGILMSTILPKLTGAQARARDTGRKADLGNISQALLVLFSDYGSFPTSIAAGGPIDSATTLASKLDGTNTDNLTLGKLLKGSTIPHDPQTSNAVLMLATNGSYFYKSVSKTNTADSSYILCSHVETPTQANADLSAITAKTTYETAKGDIVTTLPAAVTAVNYGYCVLGE